VICNAPIAKDAQPVIDKLLAEEPTRVRISELSLPMHNWRRQGGVLRDCVGRSSNDRVLEIRAGNLRSAGESHGSNADRS